MGNDDSAFKQELFDITKTQTESEVQPHGVADDLHRKAVILIFRGGGRCVHAATLTHCVEALQVDNAHPGLLHRPEEF
jgi:predicted GNAT family acetyltransferase